VVNPDGSRVDSVYDERGLLIRRTRHGADGAGDEQRWAYDRSGRLTHEITTLGIVRRNEYDPFGRLRRVAHLNGTVHEVDYGVADRPSATRTTGDDGMGTTRLLAGQFFSYDELGRTVTTTVSSFHANPGAAVPLVTTTTHDELDRPVVEVDHRGATTQRAFDAAGRLIEQIDPAGNRVVTHHDANGRVGQLDQHWQTPDGPVVITRQQVYDLGGRLTRRVHPDGSAQDIEYDARNLPVVVRDETGVENLADFNAFAERVGETVDPGGLGFVHRWSLDPVGRPVAYTDPTGQVTVTLLDGLGRVSGQDHPAGNTMRRAFDDAGRVTAEWTGAGNRVEYRYDGAGRLAQITNPSQAPGTLAVPTRTFRYDGLDRLVRADTAGQPMAAVTRRFDSLDRLRTETSNGVAITRGFDDLAGLVVTTWPDGRSERTVLDALGRVASIEQVANGALGAGTPVPTTLATVDQLGPHIYGRVDLGGVVIDRSVDERGVLSDIECRAGAVLLEHLAYRFDLRDRIGLEAQTAHPSGNRVAALDAAGRLTGVRTNAAAAGLVAAPQRTAQAAQIAAAGATASPLADYAYDSADTLLSWMRVGQPPSTAIAGAGHRYQSINGNPASYQPDGALAGYGDCTVVSDALGRVVSVTRGASTSQVSYDALGRIAGVVDGGVDERWAYFGAAVVEERRNGAPHAQITRLHDSGEVVCRHVAGTRQLTLTDLRGSLRGLISAAGQPRAWYDYAPYGAVTVLDGTGATVAAGAAPMAAVFAGMRHLPSTGLLLAGRRVYEPELGIFLSPDPFGNADSANVYTFAAGDPIDRIDPDGDLAFLAILGVMAIGALVAGGINATRQGIAMAENPARRAQGFSWSELGVSMGMGAVAAPILVLAPEVAIPMAGLGLASGANEISNGNYATGAFDIVTAIAPFGSKNVRTGTFGRGTVPGQWRGLGPRATWSERWARFDVVTSNPRATLEPAPFGEEVGIGIARPPGAEGGHSGVLIDLPEGPILFHKNGQHSSNPAWTYEAAWMREPPPSEYFNGKSLVPWDYTTSKVPKSMWQSMINEAQGRQAAPERFAFKPSAEGPPMSCGYYTGDVFSAGGIKGIPTGNSTVVFPYVSQLLNTRNAAALGWGAGFWSHVPGTSTPNRKCLPGQ
jgi:RHS repeat-associated protein